MKPFRTAFVMTGVLSLILAGGFFAQVTWATTLWPWHVVPLSYVFIASIVAAIGVPVLWIAVSGERAAIRAGSLDLAVMYAGMFIYVLTLVGEPHQPLLWPYPVVFGIACFGCVVAFGWSRRIPWSDRRPMPGPVRGSFAAFAVILIAAAAALIAGADIFPWHLTRESQVMFGLIYVGAAVYFLSGVLEPRWSNAAGQLAGFLAYDIVLLAPFFAHFDVVSGGKLVSLIVYTVLLLYSGALGAYYLFVEDGTRLGTENTSGNVTRSTA